MFLAICRAHPDEAGLVLSFVRELATLGAVLMNDWTVCRIGGSGLTALAQGGR